MEPTLSSSGSLTSRSTASMELDNFEETTTPAGRSPISGSARNTPMLDDSEKGIIVEPPGGVEIAEGSAILLNPEEDDDEDIVTPYYKRKRQSVNYNLDDMGYDKIRGTPTDEPIAKRPRANGPKVRGVIIGVWRDSSEPNDADKHVIYGFIDIHDRLRTRIYGMNRRGEELIGNIPMGAGGCWVTFPRIIFDEPLRSLNSAEIKEYVKLRSEAKPEATAEERQEADQKAILKARQIVAEETASPTTRPVVHRQTLNRGSRGGHRESLPRQTIHKTPSFQAVNAANIIQTPKTPPISDGKPPGVLLGYWADSAEPRLEDKHAVFGVLSGTDCFRCKVQRITRDGRFVDGNFPIGAGALWLHYDKVIFEPHLTGLTRPEVKEYCRIRQRDLEHRESERERKANELKAVEQAKAIVLAEGLNNGNVETPRIPPLEMETRHSARSEVKMAARQQQEAEAAAAEKARKEKADALERQHEKTRKEVAMAEAVIQEAAQQELKNNMKKLNKVWVAQQAVTSSNTPPQAFAPPTAAPIPLPPPPHEEVKYYNGIKYERKQNGPFQGKLVSNAQILTIDGEDYVEYRVLTKPSFF